MNKKYITLIMFILWILVIVILAHQRDSAIKKYENCIQVIESEVKIKSEFPKTIEIESDLDWKNCNYKYKGGDINLIDSWERIEKTCYIGKSNKKCIKNTDYLTNKFKNNIFDCKSYLIFYGYRPTINFEKLDKGSRTFRTCHYYDYPGGELDTMEDCNIELKEELFKNPESKKCNLKCKPIEYDNRHSVYYNVEDWGNDSAHEKMKY